MAGEWQTDQQQYTSTVNILPYMAANPGLLTAQLQCKVVSLCFCTLKKEKLSNLFYFFNIQCEIEKLEDSRQSLYSVYLIYENKISRKHEH